VSWARWIIIFTIRYSGQPGLCESVSEAYGNPPGFPAFHAYVTAHLIARAYEKAGAVDGEKFITALEGIKVDSPVGESRCAPATTRRCCPCTWERSRKFPSIISHFLGYRYLAGKDILPRATRSENTRGKLEEDRGTRLEARSKA